MAVKATVKAANAAQIQGGWLSRSSVKLAAVRKPISLPDPPITFPIARCRKITAKRGRAWYNQQYVMQAASTRARIG